jgi:hypothetical protein
VAGFVTPATTGFGADSFAIDPADVVRDAPDKDDVVAAQEGDDETSDASGRPVSVSARGSLAAQP